MTYEKTNPTMFDRLRRSKTARVALLLAGLALTGCASANTTNGTPGGKAKTAASASRTPGGQPVAATSSPAPAETAPPVSATSRQGWCKAASTTMELAFVDANAPNECEVMPTSSTPGDVLIKWTLNAAGVQGFLVEASIINSPFDQYTSAAKPESGSGTEYVIVPNSTQMYVKVPGNPNETGELEVLSGYGGAIPLGVQNSMAAAAGIFDVFGSTPIDELYPANA